ncbi:MAG TPA: cytochrome c family protein [Rhodospirillaceae bacterium]|nr:cytochrome c family protein [Rhodospirillaceae bacterium]
MFIKSMAGGLFLALLATGSVWAAECNLPAAAQAGKMVSNQCKACHALEADKPSRPTAPNIHDVFGEKAVTRKDFPKYSEAMNMAAGKGLVWNETNIFEYLADPKAFLTKINGSDLKNAMFFQLKDEQKRKDMVAFLKAIKGKPECN